MTIRQMMLGVGPRVRLAGGNVANGPGGTRVELEIRADGSVWRIADGLGDAQLGSWIIPNSAASLQTTKCDLRKRMATRQRLEFSTPGSLCPATGGLAIHRPPATRGSTP